MGQDEGCFRQNDVLLNSFLIKKKKCRVLLYYDKIVWEREKSKSSKTIIPFRDIITVKVTRQRKSTPTPGDLSNSHHNPSSPVSGPNLDPETEQQIRFINVHYAKRLENSRTDFNRWRKCTLILYNADHRIIRLWYNTLSSVLSEQNRPQRILMFVNPYGGRKQALGLYEKVAKPLLQLAGIDVSCVISQRANQVRDMIMTQSLEQYDAVCCVGGDGTFAEVFNGLIFRAIKDLGLDPLRPKYIPKPKLPIGVIPAGSTDTVAYCLHGTTDVQTAVIHIILGETRGLDLSSVCNSNGLVRLFASVMSYGYLGDVALESEKFRWMGPKRYDYSGFKKIIANHGYEGEIILHMPNDELNSENDDDTKCCVDCVRCLKDRPEVFCSPEIQNNNCPNNIQYIPVGSAAIPVQDQVDQWKNIRGRFFMICGANISCACSRSPNGFSPYNHLGDGYIDVVLVRHTSFLNNIRLLLAMISRSSDIKSLPFVELHRTRKFYFRSQKLSSDGNSINGSCQPISIGDNMTSQWNCDGEIIHDADVLISSHCQLIDVFMRGPHPMNESPTGCCDFCK